VNGRAVKLVETRPKAPAGELYSKTILAIDPKDLLVLRAEFFDPKGKPLKTWTVERLEKVDGIWTAMEQRMTNVQESATSRLAISDIRYNADVPDETFNRAHLGR
jgi:outer membrane lipoprotein-sorting protein